MADAAHSSLSAEEAFLPAGGIALFAPSWRSPLLLACFVAGIVLLGIRKKKATASIWLSLNMRQKARRDARLAVIGRRRSVLLGIAVMPLIHLFVGLRVSLIDHDCPRGCRVDVIIGCGRRRVMVPVPMPARAECQCCNACDDSVRFHTNLMLVLKIEFVEIKLWQTCKTI